MNVIEACGGYVAMYVACVNLEQENELCKGKGRGQ